MAVKIRLKRLGKIRVPQYRIVVVDSRKKRDGRVIEEIGKYHPKEDPSYIDVVVRPGAVLAGRRRAADRGRREDPQDHRRLAEVQGPAGHRGHPEGRGAQARQARDLQRGPQGRRQRAQGRGRDHAAAQEVRRQKPAEDAQADEAPAAEADRPAEAPAEAPAAEAPEAPAEDAPAPVPADETPEGAADAAETAETAEADADAKSDEA